MTAYPSPSRSALYNDPAEAYAQLVTALRAPQALSSDHAAVERLVRDDGREVLRLLYQSWLDERSALEGVRDGVVGVDDVERNHHRTATRPLETVFGDVTVCRDRVGARGVAALAPLDARLNLHDDRFSSGVREQVVEEAVRGSFDAAVAAISATTGASVVKRQAEELVLAAAVDFDAFYGMQLGESSGKTDDLLVLTADGKGVVMRADGLRDATRLAAQKGAHKLKKRLSKGEKKNRKRMAEVAAVYDLTPQPRSAAEILGDLDRKKPEKRPRARNKRVWASLEKTTTNVIDEMFAEALRRDPDRVRTWVVLVDGNKTQIREIRAAAKRVGVEITMILDLIHVIEYLWAAAWDVFPEGAVAAEQWVRKHLTGVLRGRAGIVAAALRRQATCKKLAKREGVDKAAAYLLAYRSMLRYDEYLPAGLPIATGVIEGACRHLVKDRMDITGARWGLEGAEAILKLRSLSVSGDMEAYWQFHRRQEFWRNHASRYADAEGTWLWQEAA